MPIYKAHSLRPPTLSLHSHTFTIQVVRETPGSDAPFWKAIGQLEFTKHAEETWSAAQSRLILAVQEWIATYEEAQAIDAAVKAWLDTRVWVTP